MKTVFSLLSCCLFFMAQTINAQLAEELKKDLEIAFAHYGSPPSHISTLDFCELEIRSKSGQHSVKVGRWYGDFHAMQEGCFTNSVKGRFL